MKVLRVGILVFDEVEVLDACGPFEVFGVAGRIASGPIGFDVTMVAIDQPTVARHGLTIVADHSLEDAPDLDLVVVPGGVTDVIERDDRVLTWLRGRAHTPTIASVCTGAFVLAEAGLLTTGRATTHWDDVDALRSRFPDLDVVDGPRWVRSGDVFTSAGISAGIDLALHLIGVLAGADLAVETAHRMDYSWTPTAPDATEGPQRA